MSGSTAVRCSPTAPASWRTQRHEHERAAVGRRDPRVPWPDPGSEDPLVRDQAEDRTRTGSTPPRLRPKRPTTLAGKRLLLDEMAVRMREDDRRLQWAALDEPVGPRDVLGPTLGARLLSLAACCALRSRGTRRAHRSLWSTCDAAVFDHGHVSRIPALTDAKPRGLRRGCAACLGGRTMVSAGGRPHRAENLEVASPNVAREFGCVRRPRLCQAVADAADAVLLGVPRSGAIPAKGRGVSERGRRAIASLRQPRRRAATVPVALPPRRCIRGGPCVCGRLRVRDGRPGSTCDASASPTGSCDQRRRRGWMRRYPLVKKGSGLAAACRFDGGVTGRLRLEAVDVVPALGFARELGKVAPATVFAFLESCRVGDLWRWSGPGGVNGAAGVGVSVESKRPLIVAPMNRAATTQTSAMPARMTAYSAIACPESDVCLPRATAEPNYPIRLE